MGASKWQLRKEGFFRELEKKLLAMQDLSVLIDSYSPDTPCDKIKGDFIGYLFSGIEWQFSEARRIRILEEQTKKVETVILDIQQGVKWRRKKKLRKWEARQKRIDKELDALKKSNIGQFLEHLQNIIHNLTWKSERVSCYRNTQSELDALKRSTRIKLDIAPENIQKTEFTVFGVMFILDPTHYRKIDTHKEETVGQHFSDSPFSLVSGTENGRSEEDVRGTIRHEHKHNILDGVPGFKTTHFPLERVKKCVAESNMKGINARKLLDNLREEIIAASEQAERVWEAGGDNDFWALRTAGRETAKMLEFLTEEQKKTSDKEWKGALDRVYRDIYREFHRIARYMKTALGVAREIGEPAREEAHLLFVLLRPSQYRHILSYLEYKYGKEKVREHLAKIQVTL